ncbi:MAG TPA: L,D-transpeptidase family protein [Candidatus Omnitrophota bacterium]|nr:L,D-transpeptidase family protein [Candidatus Omnitrophota bacterium]HQJ14895.1 L,D-transpeptidase family protein [Candidatus Omnitrophota bacterium]
MDRKRILIIGIAVFAVGLLAGLKTLKQSCPLALRSRAIVSAESAQARDLEARGDLIAARREYQRLINEMPNSREVLLWQQKVEALNIALLFSPTLTPGSIEYEIKPGDSLEKIARDHRTTVELIKKSNGLTGDSIFPGKKLKVWTVPFNIVVDKSQNTLLLKTDDTVFKSYTVATGTNNSTPVGTFRIIEKITDPPWYKPGAVIPAGSPENILGTRWLGLTKQGYGIHGTTDPKSLGTQATAGCIRMANRDVEELYSIVPLGVEVTIVD